MSMRQKLMAGVVFILLLCGLWLFLDARNTWPRGEALTHALDTVLESSDAKQKIIGRAILENYLEARSNASRWSGIYWSCIFGAATLSALAGLLLKLESFIQNEKIKKDAAALLSVVAALLITLSSSGDFQRKWQANRIAAAELEHVGYLFLGQHADSGHAYMDSIAQIMKQRHYAILGVEESAETTAPTARPTVEEPRP